VYFPAVPFVQWSTVLLCLLQGTWMLLDGGRALVVGTYITPSSGEYAGRLGPWARVVSLAGVEPESTGMKLAFVVLGVLWLAAGLAVAVGTGWSWTAGITLAVVTLWYLVPGTVISLVVLALLLSPQMRRVLGRGRRSP
jgi:hypothetical protein